MSRRSLLMAAMVALPAGLVAAPAGIAVASVPASHAASSCSRVIKITKLAFTPPAVAPGGESTAKLTARNCTGARQKTTAVWLGKFAGPGRGIPAGCPAIDPLPRAANFGAHATLHSKVSYAVPAACTATRLEVTVKIDKHGTVLAKKTADLAIVPPSSQ
jgi:hypothetical protein